MGLEQIGFYDVYHLFHLAENEDSMLRERPIIVRGRVDQLAFLRFWIEAGSRTNATIQQNLPMSKMSVAIYLRTLNTYFRANNLGACCMSWRLLVEAMLICAKAESIASWLSLRISAGWLQSLRRYCKD